ncbi:MAG: transposase [Treponema sp.]|jgi:transposase|nr:transposase [Treponema sp.]
MVENSLLQEVETGKTVIMDRASFHRKKRLEETCGNRKVFLLRLPLYYPDLNPIEKTWATMKKELRDTAPLHKLLETAIYAYLT